MDAKQTPVNEYLLKEIINEIPVFQRNYSWEKENCKQFFDDIHSAGRSQTTNIHFIGSLIVVNSESSFDQQKNSVIDGQQRLITSNLFLKAFLSTFPDDTYTQKFVIPRLFLDTRQGLIPKLNLIKNDDLVFKAILNDQTDELTEKQKNSKVFINYEYLKKLIEESKADSETLEKGLKKFVLVGISINEDENPQLIFEALNSAGKKLSESDLIKNHLLMKNISKQEFFYDNYWYKIENNVSVEYLDEFFKAFLLIKLKKSFAIRDLYVNFKAYANNLNLEDILKELLFYSNLYSKILFKNELQKNIKERFEKIDVTGLKVVYPFVLEAFAKYSLKEFDENEFFKILDLLENYLIRNVIMDRPSNGYNKLIPIWLKALKNYESFEKKLFSTSSDKFKFVKNSELEQSFKYFNFYKNRRELTKSMLYLFEKELSRNEIVAQDKLTIEHVMPQTLTPNWRNSLGENAKSTHNKYLHTVGNLTLTGDNSNLSNKPFSEKKSEFNEFSKLSLNKHFESLENWTKEEIEDRSNQLFELFIKIWEEPTNIDLYEKENIKDFDLSESSDVDFKNQKPKSFKFSENDETQVSEFKDLYISVITEVYYEHEELFNKYLNSGEFNKIDFIRMDKKEFHSSEKIADTFYLKKGLQISGIFRRLRELFDIFEIHHEKLIIYLEN
jgi:uncharacterized protein with ParB-like and HNH nuclease domain